MADDRKIDDYVNDTLALLSLRNKLNANSLWSWIHKISEDLTSRQKRQNNRIPNHAPFWTEKAYRQRATNVINGRKEFEGLHLEHPVPRGKIIHWLYDLPKLTEADVRRAIELFLITCWVTTGAHAKETYEGSEACALNRNGFRDSMPSGWCPLNGDQWARYKQVQEQYPGQLSVWATFEEFEKTTAGPI